MNKKITATVDQIASLVTYYMVDLSQRLGMKVPLESMTMLKTGIAEAINDGALERIRDEYTDLKMILGFQDEMYKQDKHGTNEKKKVDKN
jgi:hypothetical protein